MYTVYKHTCQNGKVYIGITSLDVKTRWGKNGSLYKNMLFGKAIAKYGWDNIKHEILFSGLTEKEASEKEAELINYYRSNDRKFGYNIADGGLIHRHTQQTREKMSKSRKGKQHSEQHNKAVAKALKGIKRSDDFKRKCRERNIGKKLTEEHKKSISDGCKGKGTKRVMQFSLSGEYIQTFDSIGDALREVNGKSVGNISSCCSGKKKNAYGYLWKLERGQNHEQKMVEGGRDPCSQDDGADSGIHAYSRTGGA